MHAGESAASTTHYFLRPALLLLELLLALEVLELELELFFEPLELEPDLVGMTLSLPAEHNQ
jgi:hypothetical protein